MANIINDGLQLATRQIAVPIAAATSSGNGSAVSVKDNAPGLTSATVFVGAVSGTAPTLDVKMQESVDGSTGWTDCVKSDGSTAAFPQVTAANVIAGISFRAQKPFVRAVSTIAGTSPSFTYGVYVSTMQKTVGVNTGGWINDTPAGYA